jgi:uncharacterized membrane protein
MKKVVVGVSFLALLALVGCGGSTSTSPLGTPNKADKDAKEKDAKEKPAGAFTLEKINDVTLKQGESKTVDVKIDRDKDFSDSVKLEVADSKKGLDLKLSDTEVKSSEKGVVQLTIKAADDADLGEHLVTVTGAGGKNKADSKITVKVTEKK